MVPGANGSSGQCEANYPFTTLKAECCCAANQLGAAWGSPCQKCDPVADCGGCPVGMMSEAGPDSSAGSGNENTKCVDVNECKLDANLCKVHSI